MMASYSPLRLLILVVLLFECWAVSTARSFDFYYFVQQWPGSYCGTRRGCCYPRTGKPASEFSIHGLWPNYKTGKWPQFCNPSDEFDFSQISDLVGELNSHWGSLSCPSSNGHKFWSHEWEKHGTCSLNLEQHEYFNKALALRSKIDLLGALKSAGIKPDGGDYSVSDIKEAIRNAIGEEVGVDCNVSEDGEYQLNEIYVCIDKSDASTVIKCPVYPHSKCPSTVKFPLFGDEEEDSTSSHQNTGSDEL
ncbi:hypothetical protein SUGI_0919260 [Cryptomeria japonica]|uniref:ribonuclease 3 n=1 Tax=Cryptomeria japonica TaxID=3369 RepID=UPI0024147A4D|nr:ribonuclease 3 [Cryptomeria japonica]GLJ44076.1 hypothetical protein SUGI_0919260 [Cryptomeria japonica]